MIRMSGTRPAAPPTSKPEPYQHRRQTLDCGLPPATAMLFERRFHAGIRSGEVRLSFRRWRAPRVKAGHRYRIHPLGQIEVESVREVPLGRIGDGEARQAGFGSAAELAGYLGRRGRLLDAGSRLYRVAFRYLGDSVDPRLELAEDSSPGTVADAARRLDAIDRRSRRGPWAWRLLALIAERPASPAGELAGLMGRDKRALKADVRRLKGLGLTVSLPTGYRLSPRGKAVLGLRTG